MQIDVLKKTKIHEDTKYALNLMSEKPTVILEMLIKTQSPRQLYTSFYPQTKQILTNLFPQVLETDCFNENKLHFHEEVIDTELGHLFEHILIQQMTMLKRKNGSEVFYDGITTWDWEIGLNNAFQITILLNQDENEILFEALAPTLSIFNTIINSAQTT